ncbi:MAG: hypothetical protein KJO40_08475 [Deltaproteobacteria bacterium]|nr:hypothetical protein [Deltaproteobacteria bacterium]NND27292.1 hypothetical protein [Myxococcales bacterium]MBT8464387.1 hypothetical protein [Deltaproteobacteria bacterium]MBT8483464.1 hypothetical protein [Deltaproteobacteria bacterium]NNK44105.1 hypothetical protein [Myxococcales bacterium]
MRFGRTVGGVLLLCVIGCGEEGQGRFGPALQPRPEKQTCLPDPSQPMPARLSDTGCFTKLDPLTPGPDLIPYEVSSALWTDGAFKPRYMVVPSAERIKIAEDGSWGFPDGSVLIKVFGFEFDAGDPESRRPVETRFMVRNDGQWDYFTYEWNDEGSDGALLDSRKTVAYTIAGSAGTEVIEYLFPQPDDCTTCHFESIHEVLGPKTSQLNRSHDYGGVVANQLVAMAEIDLLDLGADGMIEPSAQPQMVNPRAGEGNLEQRARAYLDANCAHCHRPGVYADTALHGLDLRYEVPLHESGLCEPMRYFPAWAGMPRVAPGNPAGSGVVQRFILEDAQRMPSIGTSVVDPFGAALLRDWIAGLPSCP